MQPENRTRTDAERAVVDAAATALGALSARSLHQLRTQAGGVRAAQSSQIPRGALRELLLAVDTARPGLVDRTALTYATINAEDPERTALVLGVIEGTPDTGPQRSSGPVAAAMVTAVELVVLSRFRATDEGHTLAYVTPAPMWPQTRPVTRRVPWPLPSRVLDDGGYVIVTAADLVEQARQGEWCSNGFGSELRPAAAGRLAAWANSLPRPAAP